MCMGMFGPPWGIPIPPEIHEQYSPELKAAWVTFDTWWKKAQEDANGEPVKKSDMPEDVSQAHKLICETLIPTYDDATGAESCYMVGVAAQMTD